jgi:hypothetical protein
LLSKTIKDFRIGFPDMEPQLRSVRFWRRHGCARDKRFGTLVRSDDCKNATSNPRLSSDSSCVKQWDVVSSNEASGAECVEAFGS